MKTFEEIIEHFPQHAAVYANVGNDDLELASRLNSVKAVITENYQSEATKLIKPITFLATSKLIPELADKQVKTQADLTELEGLVEIELEEEAANAPAPVEVPVI